MRVVSGATRLVSIDARGAVMCAFPERCLTDSSTAWMCTAVRGWLRACISHCSRDIESWPRATMTLGPATFQLSFPGPLHRTCDADENMLSAKLSRPALVARLAALALALTLAISYLLASAPERATTERPDILPRDAEEAAGLSYKEIGAGYCRDASPMYDLGADPTKQEAEYGFGDGSSIPECIAKAEDCRAKCTATANCKGYALSVRDNMGHCDGMPDNENADGKIAIMGDKPSFSPRCVIYIGVRPVVQTQAYTSITDDYTCYAASTR